MKKNNIHILVVDDDDRIRELIKKYLQDNSNFLKNAPDLIINKDKTRLENLFKEYQVIEMQLKSNQNKNILDFKFK